MTFIWPTLLIVLVCVPLLVLLYLRIQQRRSRFASRYGSLGLVQDAQGRGPGIQRHVPALFFLIGITTLIFSLARPQARLNIPRVEGTVILTFDVSGSMAADDLKPTRMEAAKAAAMEFVNNQPDGILIGVVAFSDGGISVQAPTGDRVAILSTIERLVPRRGTSIGNGILVSLNTIAINAGDPPLLTTSEQISPETTPAAPVGNYTSSVIVLLTDGENNETPDPLAAAQLASDLGVRVYTVGIGSPEGAILEIDGFTVHSQLNEPMLRQIGGMTRAEYYHAGSEDELRRIYSDLQPQFVIKPEEIELTSIFAGLSIVMLLIGGAFSLVWFGRLP